MKLHDEKWLDALADKVRAQRGRPPEPTEAQRQALRARVAIPAEPRRLRLMAIATAAAVLLVGAAWLALRRPAELAISVGHRPSAPGEWLEASADAPLLVTFAKAGGFDLQPQSAARVAEATSKRVRVELHHGRLAAEVVSAPGRDWAISAGPYTVHVVGTHLSVDWRPDEQGLVVAVETGVVEVNGDGLQTIAVRAGQQLDVDGRHGTSTLRPTIASADDAKAHDAEAHDAKAHDAKADTPEPPAPEPPAKPVPKHAPEPASPSWRALMAQGQFAQAYDAAIVSGAFNASGNADELLELANVARYHGDTVRARQVLTKLRQRFASTPQATMAAFLLGRAAVDGGDLASATRWFETYVREDPNAPLVEECMGRLIDVYGRSGERDRAQDEARRYLARFPTGAYADRARLALQSK